MGKIVSPGFDYEDWAALARDNPAAFEEKRKREIENVISRAPMRLQQRLRCLQWRIDMERDRSPNPLAACIKLYSMMWDSVVAEHGFLSALQLLTEQDSHLAEWKKPGKRAQVLPFVRNDYMPH